MSAPFSRFITIYDTVSSEAGDKVFEPGILLREVSSFFHGFFFARAKRGSKRP